MKTSLADLDQSDRLGLPPRAEEPEPPSLEARLAEAEGVLRGIAAEPCHCGGCGPALQCPPCMARAYFAAQGGTGKPCPKCDGHRTCERCGGSGGGPELPLRCSACDGTGDCECQRTAQGGKR